MNKKELLEKCRNILYKYSNHPTISNIEDRNFVLQLFEQHPEWNLKKGVGIKSISVINGSFNTKCFQLNRIDGSSTDISFTKCISNPTKISQVKKACRSAIRPEIIKFRNENVIYGISFCGFTNEILYPDNTHIDHYDITFDEMFLLWSANKSIEQLYKLINKTKDNCFETYFTDKELIADFTKFHNQHCKLRAVSKFANLSILK
jgi:Protein of unknown function (DUF3223)